MGEPKQRALPAPAESLAAMSIRPKYPKPPPPRILHEKKDMAAKYDKCLEAFREHSRCLKQNVHKQGEKFTKDFLGHLEKAFVAFHDLRVPILAWYPIEVSQAYRRDVAEIIHEDGLVDRVLCKYVVELLPSRLEGPNEKQVLEQCMKMLLDYSDCSPDITMDMAEHGTYLDTADSFIRSADDKGFPGKMLKWLLYHVYNVSRVAENKQTLHDKGVFQLLVRFVLSSKPHLRLAALATLANIAKEEDCRVFQTNVEAVDFLLRKLKEASSRSTLESEGWNRRELAEVVGQLARNEANRRLLVQRGCLPLLAQLANSEDVLDEKAALQSLWHLTLHKDNRADILKEWNVIKIVIAKCQHHLDPDVKYLASGILWDMREELEKVDKYKRIVPEMREQAKSYRRQQTANAVNSGASTEVTTRPSRDAEKAGSSAVALPGHGRVKVMLSYNREHREVVRKICEFLESQGVPVWFDMKDMAGDCVDAMAEAIETSSVICICFSQGYKASPNCESEAKYAMAQRKPIVPIKVQAGYAPDGWLGFIIGMKLFFDFTGKYPFEKKTDELHKELQRRLEKEKK